MPTVTGISAIGRQVLVPSASVSDGRMSVTLLGEQQAVPRLYGHLSVELVSVAPQFFQMFDKALWVPGLFFTLEPRLLPSPIRVAVYWKVSGLSWQFVWV